jgi:serine/threonine protein kinase
VIKLADLGNSKVMLDTLRADTKTGTFNYMSPELKSSENYHSFPTDIWYYKDAIYAYIKQYSCSLKFKGLLDVFSTSWCF